MPAVRTVTGMTYPHSTHTELSLADRVAVLEGELETRRQFGAYPRLYGPMAVLAVAFSFLPLLEDVVERTESGVTTWRYGTLWEMAGNNSGSPAALGVVLLVSLVVLLVLATIRVRSTGVPIGIAAVAALMIVMLVLKPGTSEPTPDLTDAGIAIMALLFAMAATAVVHVVHLSRWRSRLGHSLASAPAEQQPARDG